MDRTIDVAPPLFSQVYLIHADYLGRCHPLVYGILTNKRQATYRAFLNELSNIANHAFQPLAIITDFEMAAIHGCRGCFPKCEQNWLFFPFNTKHS